MLLLICVSTSVFSQTKKTIAPFKITLVDGKPYNYTQIKKNMPIALIYFSPTCDHCKDFTAELLKQEKKWQGKQMIFITYEPVAEMKRFDDEFHLSGKKNIVIGTEGYAFIVRKYYGIERFPYIALYNKEGNHVKTLSPVAKPADLVSEIVKLK